MSSKKVVNSPKGIQLPMFSQAMIYKDTIYVSGNIGMDYSTMKLVEGTVGDRTRQTLENMRVVLEEAGSSLNNLIKVNVYLADMADFQAMNEAYMAVIGEPRPARTCVAVKELPFKADVEIEGMAHL